MIETVRDILLAAGKLLVLGIIVYVVLAIVASIRRVFLFAESFPEKVKRAILFRAYLQCPWPWLAGG